MKTKNRWLIACSAVAIHLSIGSAYAYSVFKNPLSDKWGWESTQVALSFTIAIFFLGMSAATFGQFVEKRGPRVSAILAACLFASGMIGSGIAISAGSLIGYYFSYGVLGGMGLGLGYISPVSTLVKWFPDKRGLATGMAVMGFGAGSLIASPVAAKLIESVGISNTFYILGACYFVLMFSGASYISKPPEGWVPASMKKQPEKIKSVMKDKDLAQLTSNEAAKTTRFWLLWIMMFVNISAGIMLISVASPMAQNKVGMTAVAAAAMVGIMGLFNGGGRIGWAALSDYLGRSNVYIGFFVVQLIAFLILPSVSNPIVFQILIYIILTMYGGGFAMLPAFIGDLFGTKQLSAIHGYLLTAWSIAGIAGPLIVAYIYDSTNSYDKTFYIFAIMLALALCTSIIMKLNIRKIKAKTQNTEQSQVSASIADQHP